MVRPLRLFNTNSIHFCESLVDNKLSQEEPIVDESIRKERSSFLQKILEVSGIIQSISAASEDNVDLMKDSMISMAESESSPPLSRKPNKVDLQRLLPVARKRWESALDIASSFDMDLETVHLRFVQVLTTLYLLLPSHSGDTAGLETLLSELDTLTDEVTSGHIRARDALAEHIMETVVRRRLCWIVRSFQAEEEMKQWMSVVPTEVHDWLMRSEPLEVGQRWMMCF